MEYLDSLKRASGSAYLPNVKMSVVWNWDYIPENGEIIDIASRESSYEKKAEKFLSLIRGVENE